MRPAYAAAAAADAFPAPASGRASARQSGVTPIVTGTPADARAVARPRRPLRRHRARERRPRVPEQARSRHGWRGRRGVPARAASGVLWELRLALVRAHALAPRAGAEARRRRASGEGDRIDVRFALEPRGHRRRGALSRSRQHADVRAHLRLGMASKACRGARPRERRAVSGVAFPSRAAGRRVRGALPRLAATRFVSAADGHASQHRVRARLRAGLRPHHGRGCARGRVSEQGARLVRGGSRLSGLVGAFGGRFPFARVDRGRPDASRAGGGRLRAVARSVPSRPRRSRSRPRSSSRPSRAIGATARSCTSMG